MHYSPHRLAREMSSASARSRFPRTRAASDRPWMGSRSRDRPGVIAARATPRGVGMIDHARVVVRSILCRLIRPPREVTLREVCALRASEGAIAPDGAGVLLDVCRGMLARERGAHGAFVLDTTRALHMEYRAQLIEWVLDVCAGERFAPATADVAIALTVRDERSEREREFFFCFKFYACARTLACGFVCLCVLIEFVY